MDIVICNISALQYWRMPPLLRAAPMPPGAESLAAFPSDVLKLRSNAREADRRIAGHILTDLKGLSLPVHVMLSGPANRSNSAVATIHRTPKRLRPEDLVALGNGLFVLGPGATLANLAPQLTFVELLLIAFEMTGTYTIHRETRATRAVIDALTSTGALTPEAQRAYPDHIREYADAQGRRVPMTGRTGAPLPWELSFDRLGRPTELWRRPPLLNPDDLIELASRTKGVAGSKPFLKVSQTVHGGSASPLETSALLIQCLGARHGGEGWPWPAINQRIDFDREARLISGLTYCICDELRPETRSVLEINGETYHADRAGFKLQSGRTAALTHMGFSVDEVTYDQLSNFDKLEVVLKNLSRAYELPLKPRTEAFVARRKQLLKELFSRQRRG